MSFLRLLKKLFFFNRWYITGGLKRDFSNSCIQKKTENFWSPVIWCCFSKDLKYFRVYSLIYTHDITSIRSMYILLLLLQDISYPWCLLTNMCLIWSNTLKKKIYISLNYSIKFNGTVCLEKKYFKFLKKSTVP